MRRIVVGLPGREYPILIGEGVLSGAGRLIDEVTPGGRRVVLADRQAFSHHGQSLMHSLRAAGHQTEVLTFAGGEEEKSLDGTVRLYRELSRIEAERQDVILAFGGGVTGDLAGFVASTYLRGIPLVQIPTTLLAQVDSSVGGKVGINLGTWKNLIGSFYQPRAVLADVGTLSTLPRSELATGLAEVIKTAFLAGEEFLSYLEKNFSQLLALEASVLEEVVEVCCRYKASIVEADERESSLRRVLNFGHTLGHAVEAATRFSWSHGEAVAAGMVFALEITADRGAAKDALARLFPLLAAAGLPAGLPDLDPDAVLEALRRDKKRQGGRITFVTLEAVGQPVFVEIGDEQLLEALSRHRKRALEKGRVK